MLNSLFGGIKDKLKQAMGDFLESRTWPVPEAAVNLALQVYQSRIPEVESLAVKVLDGSFEVHAKVRKGLSFQSCSTFTVESCDISSERQILTLRQLGKTSTTAEKLQERILLAIVQSIFSVVLRKDPAGYLLNKEPGISVAGDLYTINLAESAISNYVREQTTLLKVIDGFVINQVTCEPGMFQVRASVRAAEGETVIEPAKLKAT